MFELTGKARCDELPPLGVFTIGRVYDFTDLDIACLGGGSDTFTFDIIDDNGVKRCCTNHHFSCVE
jgi:hypothetical protein